jgi:hypothetical protein
MCVQPELRKTTMPLICELPARFFLDEKNRSAEAELLEASSWRGEAHGDDMGEKGRGHATLIDGFRLCFIFVGKKKSKGTEQRQRGERENS